MNVRRQRTSQAAASVAALAIVLGVIPITLVAAARARFGSSNPLTEIELPWRWSTADLKDALSAPLQDAVVINLIIRSAITITWIALIVIAITTAAEIVHMLKHRGLPRPRVRGLGWAQAIARFVAVGLIALLPVGSASSASSASTASTSPIDGPSASAIEHALVADRTSTSTIDHRQPIEAFADDAAHRGLPKRRAESDPDGGTPDDGTPDDGTPGNGGRSTHLVARGESVWQIAERFGDGSETSTMEIADAILDANLGVLMSDGQRFTNPALIQPGWRLQLPPAIHEPPQPASTAPSDSGVVSPDTQSNDAGHVVHVVVEGDTLSSIAEEHLGDDDQWPTIFDANEGAQMPDGNALDDPDLLMPGWILEIASDDDPTSPPDTADDLEVARGTADESDIAAPAQPDRVIETGDTTDPTDRPAGSMPPAAAPSEAVDALDPPQAAHDASENEVISSTVPTRAAPTSTTSTSTPAMADPAEPTVVDRPPIESPQAPTPIRLEQAALLAAGILTLVGVRRARRLRGAAPRARIPVPPPDVAATERKLRNIEPGEGAARLDIALRSVGHQLAERGARIGLARVSTDGHITLRLTEAGSLAAPWTGLGRNWELDASVPIELLTDDARRAGAPCLALAQVGIDALGRSVLVDLEAAGVTAVEARAEQADDVVRAIAAGVASSLHAEVAHLVTVSMDPASLLEHPNRHRRRSIGAALDLATALIGSTTTNDRPTFDLRALRTGGEMWEPAIVFLDAADGAPEHLDHKSLPPAGHGLAIVCSTLTPQHSLPGIRVIAHADRWELDAFGELSEIVPIGLTPAALGEVAALLDDAAEPIEPVPPVIGEPADPVDEPFEALDHDIVVGLLGGVEIRSAHGELGSFERSKTVELIAWLATHRDRATRTGARTALWELDVRDATFANVVSEARRALGRLVPTPEDEEWLARTLNESLPLHERVVTDADLVEQRLHHARLSAPSHAIDVLRPAVELIRDMPFAGTSYLWPDADGITSNLVLLATTVTAELAAHALSLSDTETVFWATGHGLRVLPGHEELIALRMRARARNGDMAGVRQEWASYERVIIADAWSDGEPAPMLLELRRQLLSSQT